MEPTPVVFLTVENAEYQFSVASKKADFAEKLQLHSKKPSKR